MVRCGIPHYQNIGYIFTGMKEKPSQVSARVLRIARARMSPVDVHFWQA